MRLAIVAGMLLAACSGEPATEDAGGRTDAAALPAEAEGAPASAATATGRGEMRTFRTWQAACDNVRTCTLFGFLAEVEANTESQGFIRIERGGAPDAEPVVTLGGGEWSGEEQSPDGVLEVQVDGGRAFRVPAEGGDYGPLYVGELRGPEARALIAALRNGTGLTIGMRGFRPGIVSLEGAAASLLWMDERQGRVGTTTALMRPGDRPMTAAAPAPPVVRAVKPLGGELKPTPALLRQREVATCLSEQPDSGVAEATGKRLTAELVLWEIPCGAGAYNQSTAFYFGDAAGGALRPVPLSEPQNEGEVPGHHQINAGLDPETGRISAFNKGRGIGDCGSEQAWVWDGRRFVLVHERTMGECEGVMVDLWPVLHRAEVR